MGFLKTALIRWLIVVGMGVFTFMPDYGVAALSIQYFMSAPFLVAILDMIWLIFMAVVLPLNLVQFRWATTALIAGISGSSIFYVWQHMPYMFSMIPWYMWGIIAVFVCLGWLLVATPFWRSVHSTMPVDNNHGNVHNDNNGGQQ